MRHAPAATLPRHCHREAFAAVVLAGGYDEAGDTGRHRVQAGDVIFHRAFESHLDRFASPGAEVLVIELPSNWDGPLIASVADPDAIVRAGERDAGEALQLLLAATPRRNCTIMDWPDALAEAIRRDPSLNLQSWADEAQLHRGSLSRGFTQLYGMTPAAYRLAQRTRQAIDALLRTDAPLGALAADCGFADQAHMGRAVSSLAGLPPAALRRDQARHAATPNNVRLR